jgi:Fe-S cluster assembly protein SufD
MSVTAAKNSLTGLLAGRPDLPAAPAWLGRLRADAVDRVGALTVPTTRDEEWRFTDISPLTKIPFQPGCDAAVLDAASMERFALPEAAARLVFIDGVYAPQFSFNNSAIVVENLAHSATARGAAYEPHIGRYADYQGNVFAALNTAYLRDGASIIVPCNTAVAAPLHLLFIASRDNVASYPRCLVVAETGSTVTVVEDFVSLQDSPYFTDAVSEIAVADNAQVDHVRVQREGAQAIHIATVAVSLARASRYRSVGVALGARISRCNLDVRQNAEGAECTIDGLALIGDGQLADTHSCIDHAQPHGTSRQLHKCIVGGAAHAVFNGKIIVRPGAQRTDSSQSSRNLLLSGKARIDTKPQLEICADDVKCAHGAAVGELDAEEVFYLRSRGLSELAARNLLTYAFGAEIIDRISLPTLRRQLEQAVLAQTGGLS